MEDGLQVLPQKEAESVRDQCPKTVHTPPDGADEEANLQMRRSLLMPRRLSEQLAGPEECFLQYLEGHYSVMVFQD